MMRRQGVKAVALAREQRETQSRRATRSEDGRLKFEIERLPVIADELLSLLVANHQELDPHGFPLDPDWQEWLKLDAFGILRILTARRDGVLVGYIGNMVRTSMRHKTVPVCYIELFYMRPEVRIGFGPITMFSANNRFLDEWGVRKTYVISELAYRDGRVRAIFQRLGYAQTGEVFERVIS
jgi:hypothetical protein